MTVSGIRQIGNEFRYAAHSQKLEQTHALSCRRRNWQVEVSSASVPWHHSCCFPFANCNTHSLVSEA